MDFEVLEFKQVHVRLASKIEMSSGKAPDLYWTNSMSRFAAVSNSAARMVAAIFSMARIFQQAVARHSSVPSSDLR